MSGHLVHTHGVEQQPDNANGDVRDGQPGDVMVFMAVLLVGIVVFVALLYGFVWLMYAGN